MYTGKVWHGARAWGRWSRSRKDRAKTEQRGGGRTRRFCVETKIWLEGTATSRCRGKEEEGPRSRCSRKVTGGSSCEADAVGAALEQVAFVRREASAPVSKGGGGSGRDRLNKKTEKNLLQWAELGQMGNSAFQLSKNRAQPTAGLMARQREKHLPTNKRLNQKRKHQ